MTQCNDAELVFQDLGSREVVARFDGGKVSSDAGGLLLREVEEKFHFVEQFARCFSDHRDPDLVEHTLPELLKQRIFGLCLGYEDLNDHDQLRYDPLLAVLVGKKDPEGDERLRPQDRGKALAGKSTLNRLELTPVRANAASRYKKIVAHLDTMQSFLVDAFLQQYLVPPERIVLDVDATDNPLHGHQLGRFFHGYYDSYCYLPLYIFCGDHPLLALLRPADIDPSTGLLKHLIRIVAHLRRHWPQVKIVLRGDGGFCREHLMRWCEANGVDYLFGLAKNRRLLRILGGEMHAAKEQFAHSQQAARVFKDFTYQTRKSWSRPRRVVGKAEYLAKGENPRFVVTSLPAEAWPAQPLYEQDYCGRGDMENRIKEQQLFLFARRSSCATMRANQVRLLLSTVGYIVLRALRQFGLAQTELAQAQCDTVRLKLLKIGAVIRISVRRVYVSLSESYPFRALFLRVWENLRRVVPPAPLPAAVPSG
jgi:Transposase DDE domain group 1